MSTSSLITLFDDFGIDDNQQLERVLKKEGDSGFWSSERTGTNRPESFGLRVAEVLRGSINKGSLDNRGYGIQHFTYIGRQRILEESLKKGLFISRRINFITDHDFAVHKSLIDYDTESFVGYADNYEWSFSPDFVRDVFKYRGLIGSGLLELFPAKIITSSTTGADTPRGQETYHTDGSELDIHKDVRELASSNVVASFGEKPLVERILGHYRQNNQLANTIEMNVPWIAGMNLEALVKFVSDNKEYIDSFQRAYHKALEETIINYRDLNFARLTNQINNDIIQQELARITSKYKRKLGLHKSLMLGGAFVASIPVTAAIVEHVVFNQTLQTPEIAGLISGVASGLVATFATNTIQYRNATAELQEEKFYVLWKLSNK